MNNLEEGFNNMNDSSEECWDEEDVIEILPVPVIDEEVTPNSLLVEQTVFPSIPEQEFINIEMDDKLTKKD